LRVPAPLAARQVHQVQAGRQQRLAARVRHLRTRLALDPVSIMRVVRYLVYPSTQTQHANPIIERGRTGG
jgi:hypothetical protein